MKIAYGTPTTLTITLTSMADGNSRESNTVDNQSDKYLDALVLVSVNVGTVANEKRVIVYAWGDVDGSTLPDTITGSDAAITLENPTVLYELGVIPVPTSSKTYESNAFSVARVFGGVMPLRWGVVVSNRSGAALAASGHTVKWTGVYLA